MRGESRWGLLWGMRTGKTAVILKHLLYLRENQNVKKILIQLPPSAIPGWKANLAEWAPQLLPLMYVGNRRVFDLWNAADEGIMLLSDAIAGAAPADRRNLRRTVYAPCVDKVDVHVVDESHRIKNWTAGRTRFALALSLRSRFRYILTGTPMGTTEADVYFQIKFLDPRVFDSMSRKQFLWGYFLVRSRGYHEEYVFNESAREVFEEKMASVTSSLRLEDVPGYALEERDVKVEIEPSAEQKKKLKELRRDYVIEVGKGEGREVRAVTAAALLIKALQIENGHVLDQEGRPNDLEESPKKDWFRTNIRSMCGHHKVIVWVNFKRDRVHVKRVLDELRIGYVDFKSGLPPARRGELLDLFRDSERKRCIVAHPGSAGEGVDMRVARVSVVYGRNHDWISFAQASARNRAVETKEIVRYHPVIKGGVDERIYERLTKKGKTAEDFMARGVMNSWVEKEGS